MLYIEFYGTPPETTGMRLHFDSPDDAFWKLLMLEARFFVPETATHPIATMFPFTTHIVAAGIRSNEKNKTIVSASYDDHYADSKFPGFYLEFPQTIASFEQEAGLSLTGLKGYCPTAEALLVAPRISQPYHGFQPTIGYQNLCNEVRQQLIHSPLLAVSIYKEFFNAGSVYPRNTSQFPLREDFHYQDPDQALKHLLGIDFNTLDESVAWESDLPYRISSASIYKPEYRFHADWGYMAKLQSARTKSISVRGWEIKEPGIHLEISQVQSRGCFSYPFHKLPLTCQKEQVYLVGTYDKTLSRAEKLEGLLNHFKQPANREPLKKQARRAPTPKQSAGQAPAKKRSRKL